MTTATATDTDLRWFDMLATANALYVDDDTSEVYSTNPQADYFLRVREDDGTYVVTQLTNDRAELIGAEVRLSRVRDEVVVATVEALLA